MIIEQRSISSEYDIVIKPASLLLDGYELFQGDILMTEDIRKELRDMGLYPSEDDKLRDRQTSPTKRSKRAAISSHARRWIGPSGVPEIPYQLAASVRKWTDNFISSIPFDLILFLFIKEFKDVTGGTGLLSSFSKQCL